MSVLKSINILTISMIPSLVLSLSQAAHSQCATCGANTRAHYIRTYPRVLGQVEPAICRVLTRDRDGTWSKGSGVLLAQPGNGLYVLTCYHNIRDRAAGSSVFVRFTNENLRAPVLAARPGFDIAVLRLPKSPGIRGVVLANSGATIGEHVYAGGFGGDGRLQWRGGLAQNFSTNQPNGPPIWLEFSGAVRSGDSGAPALVVRQGKPQLIGPVWGSAVNSRKNQYEISANRLDSTRAILGLGGPNYSQASTQPQVQVGGTCQPSS